MSKARSRVIFLAISITDLGATVPMQNERQALKQHYGKNSQFAKRVDAMSDSQVLAIYLRLKGKGLIK